MTSVDLLGTFLSLRRPAVEAALERALDLPGVPLPLAGAMRYSVMAGGKRIRPLLALAVYEAAGGACGRGVAAGVPPDGVLDAVASLELVHTYSLIHDDLPCMDDDDLRRGSPTCHVVHGEAMALLAGDALQSLAFEILATRPAGDGWAARRAGAVALLAAAAGPAGMAGGQALDLAETGRPHGGEEAGEGARGRAEDPATLLRRLHALKTGRLLAASAGLGALLAGSGTGTLRRAEAYGGAVGLLFQIADDLLDVTSDAATLGKTAGKDVAQGKLTFPSLFGLDGARREREAALEDALASSAALEATPGVLAELARWASDRAR
jgi:geranylgeranyl pyrophosphate synthase